MAPLAGRITGFNRRISRKTPQQYFCVLVDFPVTRKDHSRHQRHPAIIIIIKTFILALSSVEVRKQGV